MAIRLTVAPTKTLGVAGVMAMEVMTAGVTLSVAVFETTAPDEVVYEAVMLMLLATSAPVAKPLESMVTAVLEADQVTEPVMPPVVVSEKVPVALN